jgi:hypothetical protein
MLVIVIPILIEFRLSLMSRIMSKSRRATPIDSFDYEHQHEKE